MRELFAVACLKGQTVEARRLESGCEHIQQQRVVKKWVVALSTRPLYGFLRCVVEAYTEAYFVMGMRKLLGIHLASREFRRLYRP